jgi:NDP-hexose 4-ketoreductase
MTTMVIGAGWVGAAVVEALGTDGPAPVVIDIPTHPWLVDRDAAATERLRAELAAGGIDRVVNATGRLRGTDEEMEAANVAFPRWLVDALAGTGVRLVHLGSAAEYGDPGSADPVSETAPCRPRGAYGETKYAGSQAVLAARAAGLEATVARGFNLVSAHLAPVSPLAQWLTDVAALPPSGGTIEVWEADTVRDYVLLSDLAGGLAALAAHDGPLPDVVNLCSGVGLRYGDVVAAMVADAGKTAEVVSLGQGGIMTVIGDPRRLIELTGIEPRMSLEVLVAHAGL